uniref:C-type lectin domain-containing protein n=1 Tax=Catharus ustulatus TaxID=91951 RepID=A0A8C3TVY5_CATUS
QGQGWQVCGCFPMCARGLVLRSAPSVAGSGSRSCPQGCAALLLQPVPSAVSLAVPTAVSLPVSRPLALCCQLREEQTVPPATPLLVLGCSHGWVGYNGFCYYFSRDQGTWEQGQDREDCGNRGSMLLVPWDQDELEFLNESLQKPTRHFWIGLSVPVAGTGWMWENGSDLDQEHGIVSQDCNTRLQWICKRESAEI